MKEIVIGDNVIGEPKRLTKQQIQERKRELQETQYRENRDYAYDMVRNLKFIAEKEPKKVREIHLAKKYSHSSKNHGRFDIEREIETHGLVYNGSEETLLLFLHILAGSLPKSKQTIPTQIPGWNLRGFIRSKDLYCKRPVTSYALIRSKH